jgi:hypothetical protein
MRTARFSGPSQLSMSLVANPHEQHRAALVAQARATAVRPGPFLLQTRRTPSCVAEQADNRSMPDAQPRASHRIVCSR